MNRTLAGQVTITERSVLTYCAVLVKKTVVFVNEDQRLRSVIWIKNRFDCFNKVIRAKKALNTHGCLNLGLTVQVLMVLTRRENDIWYFNQIFNNDKIKFSTLLMNYVSFIRQYGIINTTLPGMVQLTRYIFYEKSALICCFVPLL